MYPETDLGVYARGVGPFSYPYDVIPYFQPYDVAHSFYPYGVVPFTHTGLQHSDSWRPFNQQAETSRPASTPPEVIRPFPWTVAFKHTCYNRLPFCLEEHTTGRPKVHKHTRSPLACFPLPEARFRHIHIDIIGPFPPSNSFSYILTYIDRFTR
nr:hypothetical transcript [Hymenolepis microstoma]